MLCVARSSTVLTNDINHDKHLIIVTTVLYLEYDIYVTFWLSFKSLVVYRGQNKAHRNEIKHHIQPT